MCKIGREDKNLGLEYECCGDDPDECTFTTVEADMLAEACDAVVDAATFLKAIIGEYEDDDLMIMAKYMDVQQAIAELTQQLVAYMEPDAGMEDIGG